jgi:hypothetical protein
MALKRTFKLEVDCENAAFEEWQAEIARILRELAHKLDQDDGRRDLGGGYLMDVNGNRVGDWRFTYTR